MEARTCDFCKRTITDFGKRDIFNIVIYPYLDSGSVNGSDCEEYDMCAKCINKWHELCKRSKNDE